MEGKARLKKRKKGAKNVLSVPRGVAETGEKNERRKKNSDRQKNGLRDACSDQKGR